MAKNIKITEGNSAILQVGVKVLLQDQDGKYLLLRRSLEKYPEVNGRWDIVGGRINPGQTLLENLKREVKEETQLEIVGVPKLIYAQDIFPSNSSGKHIVRLTYIGEYQGEVVLDKEENDLFKWCNKKEMKELNDLDVYLKEVLENIYEIL